MLDSPATSDVFERAEAEEIVGTRNYFRVEIDTSIQFELISEADNPRETFD